MHNAVVALAIAAIIVAQIITESVVAVAVKGVGGRALVAGSPATPDSCIRTAMITISTVTTWTAIAGTDGHRFPWRTGCGAGATGVDVGGAGPASRVADWGDSTAKVVNWADSNPLDLFVP